MPKVFVSATSRDLKTYRKAVADTLVTLEVLPVSQDHFGPDYRTVVEKLREEINKCNAVICLIGPSYGYEPTSRADGQPRRSYTQLEYEIAVELKKPVFVFIATEGCRLDEAMPEPEELQALQREHLRRLTTGDRIYLPFRSLEDLTAQVRVMRFDDESLKRGPTSRLAALVLAELVETEADRQRRGQMNWVCEVIEPFHDLLGTVLDRWHGRTHAETATQYELSFDTADKAVSAALGLHQAVRQHDWNGPRPGLRLGIHVGQVVHFSGVEEDRTLQASQAMGVCRQLTELASAGQTLLTRTAFDIARENIREVPADGKASAGVLRWKSHGRYLITDLEESLEVYEVGEEGLAPLTAPADSVAARRADSIEQVRMQGWRPALGQEIPRRPGWIIERKLGEGGFGEVWVARHDRMRELHVFKFCFDASRLSSFKREMTLFRLLRDALGERQDIARLVDIAIEDPPFFLESHYVAGGNLHDWALADGRLAGLTLEARVQLLAQVAGAVAAAHSVGIIHKDIKPSNIFMKQGGDGVWQPMLADFGIGAVADRAQLEQRGITVAGFTQSISSSGTPMYQPPELSQGKPATVQGDVYALGVLLYQLLIGRLDQPLASGWERRLTAATSKLTTVTGSSAAPAVGLLRDDIADCVDGEPAARLERLTVA
jgi:hypothetical protein